MNNNGKKMRFRKPPLTPSIFALVGVGILLSLGTWQAQKYVAKTGERNADICAEERAPIYTGDFTTLDQSPYASCPDKMALSGQFLDAIQIAAGPRMHDEEMGYHLYIPLIGDDGSAILVNTGWNAKPRISAVATTASNIQFTGTLLRPSKPNYFTPDNDPQNDQWFSIKIEEIREKYPNLNGDALAEHVFIASAVYPVGTLPEFVPAEMAKSFLTPQMHLQYAGFWYFMALALIGVFIMRFTVTQHKD